MPQATLALVLALTANTAMTPVKVDPHTPTILAPHRATYDIRLKKATDQSGVDDMSGRMVYEFNGSTCTGYKTNFRFVTKIETGDQVSVTDQQIKTFENVGASRFDFESKSFTDDKLDKDVKGFAMGKANGMQVELKEPQQRELQLAKALFPSQHVLEMIDHARKGNRFFETRIFDGTEDGDKSYLTTTVLGKTETLGKDSKDPLSGHSYWPVSIAYYEDKSSGDQLPIYTQSFNLYDNGITRDLTLDYGDVILTGNLSKLEMLPAETCNAEK
ncbi:cell envelope integrity EipB family protein [Rhizobium oryziradicis]|uniref:ATP-binding protein n=1 Tax=Rhizobium oryziradicis TaxID=1867956 RepID=A0A1Q8ZPG5_9HYPH|nr:cell envelope integrity EipB family protein [Rhizobium oryziradicis]OLP43656.1 ATP-binding protein [Rhizobium oryziradicis]